MDKNIDITLKIGNFLENERYLRILYSKNYHIDYTHINNKIIPKFESNIPANNRNIVDFPQPDGPKMDNI